MHYDLVSDARGWGQSLIATESPRPPQGLAVDPLTVAAVGNLYTGLWTDGAVLHVPADDRTAWRALAGNTRLSGAEIAGRLHTLRGLRGWLRPTPETVDMPPDRTALGVTHEFPDMPGLCWRPISLADLTAMAEVAVRSGVYSARCPDSAAPCHDPPEAHAWCHLAARLDSPPDTGAPVLASMLVYEGEPLQAELVHLDPATPTFTLTFHFNRERPHWFWREAERPVLAHLRARGIEIMYSRTRKDRPDWIAQLQQVYGAEEVGEWNELTTKLRFRLDDALARCTGWPSRSSLAGWTWSHGPVTVREMAPEELPAVKATITDLWGAGHPAVRNVLRILRDQWVLDRATVLLGLVNGQVRQVHALRGRTAGTVNDAILTRIEDPETSPAIRAIRHGVHAWCRAVGYSRLTGWIPDGVWDDPRFRRYLQHAGARPIRRHTRFRQPMTEIEVDLLIDAGRSDADWNTWRAREPLPPSTELWRVPSP